MDLKKIAENYPKAYGRQITWRTLKSNPFGGDRELFDFFDKYEIFIDIDHEFGEDWTFTINANGEKEEWTFTIDANGEEHEGDDAVYDSRAEAEAAAFEKAFEILEGRL